MGAPGNGGLLESSRRSHEAKAMVKEAESGTGGQWAWVGCTAGSPLCCQPGVDEMYWMRVLERFYNEQGG